MAGGKAPPLHSDSFHDLPGSETTVSDYGTIDMYLSDLPAAGRLGSNDQAQMRLNEAEVYALCDLIGLTRCATHFVAAGASDSEREDWARQALGLAGDNGRIVLKVVGRKILHKTEVGGVSLMRVDGTTTPADVLAKGEGLLADLEKNGAGDLCEGLLATRFVPHRGNTPGQEVLLSLRQDPAFGPVVVLGIGGTLTEWFGKATGGESRLIFAANGLRADEVSVVLEAHPVLSLLCQPSRLYPEPPIALAALADAVVRLARLGEHFGPAGEASWTLEEIEINPAVATGGGLVALDGVGLVSRRKWAPVTRPLEKIDPLLAPRSAVVMGVSAKSANPGRIILNNLRRSEGVDQQRLYVVHPSEATIAGVPCFPTVADLPETCDLAVVSVPAEGALTAITELIDQAKAQSIILIPGGFAETGEKGLAEAIEQVLRRGNERPDRGPVMVGANCLGIVSRDNYNTFFLPEYKLPFRPGAGQNLAVVSQSGAYVVTFASNYDGLIHPRASISFGNQMDLTVADFLNHFNGVDGVDVIACYVEGFREGDGQRFVDFARQARAKGKKVIVFKAGKTALGAQAAASHTASLAGDYAVARSCLTAAGVIVAESLNEFEDLIKTFTLLSGRPAQGNRVGIISNAGFECSTVMDALDGLELAVFDEASQRKLDEALPPFAHRSNPIDCTPMTATAAFGTACQEILASSGVDVAILSAVPVTPALDNLVAAEDGAHQEDLSGPRSQPSLMIEALQGSTKPAVVVVDSGEIYDPMCRMIEAAGTPVFRKIDRAARALAAYCRSEGASA